LHLVHADEASRPLLFDAYEMALSFAWRGAMAAAGFTRTIVRSHVESSRSVFPLIMAGRKMSVTVPGDVPVNGA